MRRLRYAALGRALFACVLLPALAVAPSAIAEIYKCVDRPGVVRYQNFPCAVDSLGSLPTDPRAMKATPASGGPARTNAAPVAVAASRASEPRAGMTSDEVKSIWGEPEQMVQDEPPSGRVEIWEYADGRSVRFNNKQRVLSVSR